MLVLNDDVTKGGMFAITSDGYNIILNKGNVAKSGAKEGEIIWSKIGFYPDLASLVSGMVSKEILIIGFDDINNLYNSIQKLLLTSFKSLESGLSGSATENIKRVLEVNKEDAC